MGPMLAQKDPHDGKERDIYYLGKKFTNSEQNYSDSKKTYAALVWV